MKMSIEDFAKAIQAAYVEGYVQGSAHPGPAGLHPVIPKAKELAALFWRACEKGIAERWPERSARRARTGETG